MVATAAGLPELGQQALFRGSNHLLRHLTANIADAMRCGWRYDSLKHFPFEMRGSLAYDEANRGSSFVDGRTAYMVVAPADSFYISSLP